MRAEVSLGGQLLVCPCPLTAHEEEVQRPTALHVQQALSPLRLHFKYQHKNLLNYVFLVQFHVWVTTNSQSYRNIIQVFICFASRKYVYISVVL